MTTKGIISICVVFLSAVLISCGKDRVENRDQIIDGGATGEYGPMYVIYDDEVKTNGDFYLYPGGDNQTIDVLSQENPIGKRCIKYSWNGGDVFNINENENQHTFAGVCLKSLGENAPAYRDFSQAGYTHVHFSIRGSLGLNVSVKIEAPDDGNTTTDAAQTIISSLTNSWTQYSFNIPSSALSYVPEFFKATLIFTNPDGTDTNGTGGVIYIDNIYYEK